MVDRLYWRLDDMRNAINEIKSLLDGKEISVLTTDRPTRAAFERFPEMLSEASRHIPEDSRNEFSGISWRQVADLGNFIRHVYHKIDLEGLWSIYENGLHPLELVVDALISRFDPPRPLAN